MRISALKRWHWIVIALILGYAGGRLREVSQDFEDELDSYGTLMTNQRQFEDALNGTQQGLRQFKDITVYPYAVSNKNATKRLIHVVSGWYWNGQSEYVDGQERAKYVRTCFLAPVPYSPVNPIGTAKPGGTVIDYLRALHDAAGLTYRYAWWSWATKPMFLWLAGSLLVIGGIWPTIIYLLTFGTLYRPKDEEGISLWNSEPASSRAAKPAVSHPPLDLALLSKIDSELSELLASPATGDAMPASQVPVRKLNETKDGPQVEPAKKGNKAFGAESGDYYPTEVHHHPRPKE